MGGGKGGGGTSTQYSGVQIPQEVLQRYNKATDRAEQTSQQPWANYGGEFVAPVNATQTAGYGQMMAGQNYTNAGWEMPNQALSQGVGAAAPLLNQASGSINTGQAQGQALGAAGLGQAAEAYAGAQPYNQQAGQAYGGAYGGAQPYNAAATGAAVSGMGAVDPSQLNLNQFYNPFQEQVTQATMAQLGQQQAQQRNDQRGQMIKEGSWGGDRGGVANANMVNQQNLASAQVLGNLNTQNYGQALSAAQQQQGVGLGAAQANRQAVQQGAGQLLGIGSQGYQQGMGLGQAQQGLGQQQYQQGMGSAQYTGQMGQQLYGQGVGAGQAQQGLGAAQYGMYGDVAAKQAALANQAFTQNMQTAQGQIGFGSLQQQTQQAQDSALYNQWMQERGYPFQTSQFYTNAVMGTGPLSGSSSYSGAFTPQPFFSDERLKENMEPIGTTHDGQVIYRYNFKGQPGATQLGLSAQEVERRHPEAVTEHDGAKAVAYGPATDDAAERSHKAAGGPLGGDVFAYQQPTPGLTPGVGILGKPPSLPTAGATPITGGSIGDIVGLQRAMLAANAPGSGTGKPPSEAGITTPGAPPSGPGAPTPASPVAGAVAAGLGEAGPRAVPSFIDPGGSANGATGDSSGSPGGEAGSVGAGVGTAAGDAGAAAAGGNSAGSAAAGVGGDDGGTYASGGSVGLGRAAFAKGGDAEDFWGRQRQMAQEMYGVVPWSTKQGGAGTGSLIPQLQQATASKLIEPPKVTPPAAAKPVASQATEGVDDLAKTAKGVEGLYGMGKDVLVGSPAKGSPGYGTPGKPGYVAPSPDYKPATEGWFGKGGVWDRTKAPDATAAPANTQATATPAPAPAAAPEPVSPDAKAPPTTPSANASGTLPTAPVVDPSKTVSDATDSAKTLGDLSTETTLADSGLIDASSLLDAANLADASGVADAGLGAAEVGTEVADIAPLAEDAMMFARKGGRVGYSGLDKDSSAIPFGGTSVLPAGVYDVEDPSKLAEAPKPDEKGGGGKKKDGTGKLAGTAAGMAGGAALGSIIPGIGTMVGAGLGSMVGGMAGDALSARGGRVGYDSGGAPGDTDIPLRDPGLGSADSEPQSLYGPGGPGTGPTGGWNNDGPRDLDDWHKADSEFPWDMHSSTQSTGSRVPEGNLAPSKRHYENSRVTRFADGGEVNDNEPTEPGLAPAAEAIEPPDNVHYGVFSRSQGHKMVGRATTRNRARTILHKRDNDYGAYDHFIKPIPPTRKRYAGGRLAYADAGEVTAEDEAAERKLVEERLRAREEGLGAAKVPTDVSDNAPPPPPAPGLVEAKTDAVTPSPIAQQILAGGRGAGFGGVQVAEAPTEKPVVPTPEWPATPSPLVMPDENKPLPQIVTAPPPPAVPGMGNASTAPVPTSTQTVRPPTPAKPPTPPSGGFDAAVNYTLGHEGGYVANDAGKGPTNYGINGQSNPEAGDVSKLTREQAVEIYRNKYWFGSGADKVPENAQAAYFDAAVNQGPEAAKEMWKQSGGDVGKFLELRRQRYESLIASNPKQYAQYAQTWSNRLIGLGGAPLKGIKGATTQSQSPTTTTPTPKTPDDATGLGASNTTSKSMYGENKDWWDRNEQWSMPLLHGIGKMLSSQSRTLLGSIGEGLAGGTEQYMTRGQRQQQTDISKQTQNVNQATKLAEGMMQISREKSGLLADNPMADTSAYDKTYAAMRSQWLHLMGITGGAGIISPSNVEWLKQQPATIQDFTAHVVPQDNPFLIRRNAYMTQDAGERQRLLLQAEEAMKKVISGTAMGRDGKNVLLTPELRNAALEWQRQTQQAQSTGAEQVPTTRLKQITSELTGLLGSHSDPSELSAPDQKRYNDLLAEQAAERKRLGLAAGGRVARRIGGILPGALDTGGDEGDPNAPPTAAPAVATDADVGGDNVQLAQGAGPAPPPPAPPPPAVVTPKPAEPPKSNPNDPAHWDRKADNLDKIGNHEAAAASREKARSLREQAMEGKALDEKGAVVIPPGSREAEQKKYQHAQNQETMKFAQQQSLAAEIQQQELLKYRSTLFNEDGTPKTTMGPVGEILGPLAQFAQQLLGSSEYAQLITGISNPDQEVAKKSRIALAQAIANSGFGSKETQGIFEQVLANTPGTQMSAAAAAFMIDHIFLPKAKFDAGLYGHLKSGNIYDDDFWDRRLEYYRQNHMYPPTYGAVGQKKTDEQPAVYSGNWPETLSGVPQENRRARTDKDGNTFFMDNRNGTIYDSKGGVVKQGAKP